MQSKNYILDKIRELVTLFSNIRARYDFDSLSDTHSIEVVPNELYTSDQFNEWQTEVILDFGDKFPMESICFLTDNSLIGIDEYQLEFMGDSYLKRPLEVFHVEGYNDLMSPIFIDFTTELFTDFTPNLQKNISFTQHLEAITIHKSVNMFDCLMHSNPKHHELVFRDPINVQYSTSKRSENNYVLAS